MAARVRISLECRSSPTQHYRIKIELLHIISSRIRQVLTASLVQLTRVWSNNQMWRWFRLGILKETISHPLVRRLTEYAHNCVKHSSESITHARALVALDWIATLVQSCSASHNVRCWDVSRFRGLPNNNEIFGISSRAHGVALA